MHVPDHLISDPVETVAAVSAVALIAAVAVRPPRDTRPDHALHGRPGRPGPQLATAALVFALQMVNFPVLPGTSGHLLGGALATALVGPRRALPAVSAVVVSQAVFFADGGVGALGVNLWLIAILPVAVAASVGRLHQREPGDRRAVIRAAGLGAVLGAPVAALGFVAVYLAGGAGSTGSLHLVRSMVGVHLAIGLGEALLTVAVLGVVAAVVDRTDLPRQVPVWGAALLGAGGLSLLASSRPDGLERVIGDLGLAVAGPGSPVVGGPFEDYAVAGLDGWLAGSLAGLVGVLLTALVASVLLGAQRRIDLAAVRGG